MKRKKLVVMMISIISIIIFMGVFIAETAQRKLGSGKNEYALITSSVYESVQSEIQRPISISLSMANDTFMTEMLESEGNYTEQEMVDKMAVYLSRQKEVFEAQTAFVVSEKTGRYYSYDGLNKVIDTQKDAHDVWYSIFKNSRKAYDLDVDTDEVNGNCWTVFVNVRIEDENQKLLGVCGIGVSMEKLQQIIKDYEDQNNVKINFINSEGVVQIDTDSVNIENAYLYDVQYGKEKDGYAYTNENGEYVVMRYVDSLNWYLVIHGEKVTVTWKDIAPALLTGVFLIVVNIFAELLILGKTNVHKKEK